MRTRARTTFETICTLVNLLIPDSAKSKTDKFSKIINWVKLKKKKHQIKVLPNSFAVNGHTLGFFPQNQKLKNYFHPRFYSRSQSVNMPNTNSFYRLRCFLK